jgi:Family of unknown function (DUF5990)
VILEIRGRQLPGPDWYAGECARRNIYCGLQLGRDPHELVRGGTAEATWTVDLRVQADVDGALDFRGQAVQGRRGERFVYLTWGEIGNAGEFSMFRRAKLMLGDLAPLCADGVPDRVVAEVDLTDDHGGPRCARLTPPALTLFVG